MSQNNDTLLAELLAQSSDTIDALVADGADPTERFEIEHHLASPDFTKLEKSAVELVKLGYHVDDADEFELDDGSRWFAFAALVESPLDEAILAAQTKEILAIAQQCHVDYDGWGTYLGDEEGEDDW